MLFKKNNRSLKDRHREKREEKINAKDKQNIENASTSVNKIINELESIAYVDAAQRYGDDFLNADTFLAYTNNMVNSLRDESNIFSCDISSIDEKLLNFASKLSNSVKSGKYYATHAGINALMEGIIKLRPTIRDYNGSDQAAYVKSVTEYLDEWDKFIKLSEEMDAKSDSYKKQKIYFENKEKEFRAFSLKIENKVRDDLDYQTAMFEILGINGYALVSEKDYSDKHRSVERDTYKIRSMQVFLEKVRKEVISSEIQMQTARKALELQHEEIMNGLKLDKGIDLNLFIAQAIKSFKERQAKADAEVKQFNDSITELEGAIEGINNLPGNQSVRQISKEQSKMIVKKIEEDENRLSKNNNKNEGVFLSSEEYVQRLKETDNTIIEDNSEEIEN